MRFARWATKATQGGQRMQFKTWVEEGIIKNVRKVDACMNKGRRWHPWGNVKAFPDAETMPKDMNWDVWAGTAPKHNYSSRFDKETGVVGMITATGAFGDWGPHTFDSIHRFLKLGMPHEIRADKLEGKSSISSTQWPPQ